MATESTVANGAKNPILHAPQAKSRLLSAYVGLICSAMIVKAYKIAGLIILSVILVGMGAYLLASAFYLLSANWALPSILTPGNDKVIAAQLSYLDKVNEFDRIQAEQVSLAEGIRVADQSILAWREFADSFSSALNLEATESKKKLVAVEGIVHAIEKAKNEVGSEGELTLVQLDEKLKAGIIDLTEHERLRSLLMKNNVETAENYGRMVGLHKQVRNLRQFVRTGENSDVDLLLRQKPLIEAQLALAKEEANKIILTSRVAQLSPIIDSYKKILESMRKNPYVKASAQEIPIAFISYENLSGVEKGTPVFSCVLEFIFCQRAGTVTAILEAEVAGRHPVSGKDMRGKMAEIELLSITLAHKKTLILKRPPFLI